MSDNETVDGPAAPETIIHVRRISRWRWLRSHRGQVLGPAAFWTLWVTFFYFLIA